MELHISEIAPEVLPEKERKRYEMLDKTPYGMRLARAVAGKLLKHPTESGGLYFAHRDYCGMGLYIHDGKFTLGTVNDGRGPFPVVATFEAEEEFVKWLAAQSDRSMALYGEAFDNQTITKIRLRWYLEDDYHASWNSYCQYLRRENEV